MLHQSLNPTMDTSVQTWLTSTWIPSEEPAASNVPPTFKSLTYDRYDLISEASAQPPVENSSSMTGEQTDNRRKDRRVTPWFDPQWLGDRRNTERRSAS